MKKIYLVLLLVAFSRMVFAQLSEDKIKAQYIHIFAKYIEWEKEDQIKEFTIGVFGEKNIIPELENIIKLKPIKDKPFKIIHFSKFKDIGKTQILYVEYKKNDDIKRVTELVKGTNTLLITDRCELKELIMINLLPLEGQKKYEVNKKNILDEKLTILPQLLLHGGTETDLKDIYRKADDQLKTEVEKVEALKAESKKQLEEIKVQQDQIAKQNSEIDRKNSEIKIQEGKIEKQKVALDNLLTEIDSKQKDLDEKVKTLNDSKEQLEKQTIELQYQQEEMLKGNQVLSKQKEEIAKGQQEIEDQKTTLKQQGSTIQTQQTVLYLFIGFFIIISLMIYFIYRQYKAKKLANLKLEEQNVAINMQKEEIQAQAEQLELTNIELEKLSIVARETDNAVLIMNAQGDFEWVNESYTRMFGFSLEQLVGEISANIIGPNTPDDLTEMINRCLVHKETVTYEFSSITKAGKKIWIQATLTPIIDVEGRITKVIAVDSEITKIKEAEQEILIQKNKIEKAYQNIQVISEFGQKLTSTLELESINTMIYDYVSTLMDASAFGIGVYNDVKNRLEFRTFVEKRKPIPFFTTELTAENSLSVWCFNNLSEVFINDFMVEYKKYIKILPSTKTSEIPQSVIYLPLTIENRKIGVVTVQSYEKNAYGENDFKLLQTMASYISIALDNANAYKIINTKNQHISGSIRYAKTIQQAILPIQENMDKVFESFAIFRPKDIVSGDFYWFSKVDAVNGTPERIFVAAVDCTGHGVPGAFMSMIGNRLLSEIVNERKVYEPCKILEDLNLGVIVALRQDQTDNNDGMDVCLCELMKINDDEYKVTFCGAKRPLFVKKSNDNKIDTIRGTRKSIGGARHKRNKERFEDQEVILHKGDMIYLTSDGIMDQNAEDRKRFGTDRFVELLEEVGGKQITEQKVLIEKAIDSFQSREEQRDDVTIVGIKL